MLSENDPGMQPANNGKWEPSNTATRELFTADVSASSLEEEMMRIESDETPPEESGAEEGP